MRDLHALKLRRDKTKRDRIMKLVIGLDGHGSGDHALAFAKELAAKTLDCELIVVYVIEWGCVAMIDPRYKKGRPPQPPFPDKTEVLSINSLPNTSPNVKN